MAFVDTFSRSFSELQLKHLDAIAAADKKLKATEKFSNELLTTIGEVLEVGICPAEIHKYLRKKEGSIFLLADKTDQFDVKKLKFNIFTGICLLNGSKKRYFMRKPSLR